MASYFAPEVETFDTLDTHSTVYKRGLTLCSATLVLKFVVASLLLAVLIWTIFSELRDVDRTIFNVFFNAINFLAAFVYAKWSTEMMDEINTQVNMFKMGLALLRRVIRHPSVTKTQCNALRDIAQHWFALFVIRNNREDVFSMTDVIDQATQTLDDDDDDKIPASMQIYLTALTAHVRSIVLLRQTATLFTRAATVINNIFMGFYLFVLLPLTIFHQTDSIVASIVIAVIILVLIGYPMIWLVIVGDPFSSKGKLVHQFTGPLHLHMEEVCKSIEDNAAQLQGVPSPTVILDITVL